ncbi:hypothetical protein OSJ57_18560 [Sphingomonas sp. HH69]
MNQSAKPKPARTPLWLTLPWVALLCGVAVVAIPAEIDRESLRHPGLAQSVPAPLRSFAQTAIVVDALESSDSKGDLDQAEELVRRRPVPEESLASLGLTAARQGNDTLTTNAFYLAGGHGWRVPQVQEYAAASAMETQQPTLAAYRLAALWKTRNTSDITKQLTVQLLAIPDGRKEFARLLTQGGSGMPDFLNWVGLGLPPQLIAKTLLAMRRTGYPFDCTDMSQATQSLVSQGRAEAAIAMWQSACGTPGTSARAALGFTDATTNTIPGPFDWTYPGSAGVDVSTTLTKGGLRLDYSNTDALRHPIATRLAMLNPGHHRIDAQVSGDARQSVAVMLQIACSASTAKPAPTQKMPLNGQSIDFDIPPQGCDMQTLTISAQPGSGTIGPISLN